MMTCNQSIYSMSDQCLIENASAADSKLGSEIFENFYINYNYNKDKLIGYAISLAYYPQLSYASGNV